METSVDILEILKIELPCDSAIAKLVMSLKGSKETLLQRYMHNHNYCRRHHNNQEMEQA